MFILSKHEKPDSRAAALQQAVLERCQTEGIDCLVIPPLYRIAESSKLWDSLSERSAGAVFAGWFHPRPVRWLLHRHGIMIEEPRVLDLRTFADADAVFGAATSLGAVASSTATTPRKPEQLRAGTRDRWYPVVDGSRCINCGHCLQFCLFGVYALDADGRVRVQNPDQCKNGCPACSRICPQGAIMFPLHDRDEAIAGAPGKFVALDAAARRMFYTRTQQPCPQCGQKAGRKSQSPKDGPLCPECGGRLPEGTQPPASADSPSPETTRPANNVKPAFDDLDLLVDQLDQAMQRRD
jgi:Pyruvate/2-oxoacid:ferredoxin oxidoreductase delta subunit